MLSSRKSICSAKLADFGLAETLNLTNKSGILAGTAGYLAPEIIEDKAYGTPVEIWSLGCLLYAMLTVSLPFADQQEALRNEPHPIVIDYNFLDLDNIETSDACKDLISRMLIKDPKKRLCIE